MGKTTKKPIITGVDNHSTLLSKISEENYMTWELVISLGETTSAQREVNTGVPQSTILGPLLCILSVNDLLNKMPNTIFSYAGDTKLLSSYESWS